MNKNGRNVNLGDVARIATLAMTLIITSISTNARTLSLEEALSRATKGNTMRKSLGGNKINANKFVRTIKSEKGTPEIYLFQSEGEGYLVLSAEEAATPILGYSTTGKLTAGDMPEALEGWLQSMADEINYASENGTLMKAPQSAGAAVEPLLKSQWGQTDYYNLYTPVVNGVQTPTGCVATAMSQLMYYHKWPVSPRGSGTAKDTNGNSYSMSFDGISFDWDNMTDTYSSASTQTSKEAVSLLMKCAGYSVDMNYGMYESGASMQNAQNGFRYKLSYSSATSYIPQTAFNAKQWDEMMYSQIASGLPVLYTGYEGFNNGGHAFVCDGYDGNGYYHFNFGWNGNCDGYYLTSCLKPQYYGMVQYNYNYCQSAIINAVPDNGSNYNIYDIATGRMYLSGGNIYASVQREFKYNEDYEAALMLIADASENPIVISLGNYNGYAGSETNLEESISQRLDKSRQYTMRLVWRPAGESTWRNVVSTTGSMFIKYFDSAVGGVVSYENGNWTYTGQSVAYDPNTIKFSSIKFDNSVNIVKGRTVNLEMDLKNNLDDYNNYSANICLVDVNTKAKTTIASKNLELDPNQEMIMVWQLSSFQNIPNGQYYVEIIDAYTSETIWVDSSKIFNVIDSNSTQTITDGLFKYLAVSPTDNRIIGTASGSKLEGDVTIPSEFTLNGEKHTVTSISPNISGLINSSKTNSLVIDANVAYIRENELCGFTFKSLVLPPTIRELKERALSYCNNLGQIICRASVPPLSQAFTGDLYTNARLYVPAASKSEYTADTNWGMFQRITGIDKEYTEYTIDITPKDIQINRGETATISYKVAPEFDSPDIELTEVLDEGKTTSICTPSLNSDGTIKVSTNSLGSSVIRSRLLLNGNTSECKVTVVQPATSISLNEDALTLQRGTEGTLTATVGPEDVTDASVKWASTDESVATVANGKVKAVSAGECDIVATTHNGLTAKCHIKVIVNPEGITLDMESKEIYIGSTLQLNATLAPSDVTENLIVWTSSDPEIATVDETGKVSSVSVGEVQITATTVNGHKAICKVKVLPILAESITLSKTEIGGETGEQIQLSAVVLPENTTFKTLEWSSSDTSIATVDNTGLVTLVKAGTATITVGATDGSGVTAQCSVSITQPATSITLSDVVLTLQRGTEGTLTATVDPEDVTDASVKWASTDESVATVANGKVKAVSAGECDIVATTHNGLTAKCHVEVLPILVESIEIIPNKIEAEEGSEITLKVVILPEDADNKELDWTTSDDMVVSVTEEGVATINAPGSAVITATATDGSGVTATCEVSGLAFTAMMFDESRTWYIFTDQGVLLKKCATREDIGNLQSGTYIITDGKKSYKVHN